MNNKKGFTLVELLATIAIIAIIAVIAVPAVTKVSQDTKAKMYDTKVKLIEQAAKAAYQDGFVWKSCNVCLVNSTSGNCLSVPEGTYCFYAINTARDGYIDYDEGTDLKNPKNKKLMNHCVVFITIAENGRVDAKLKEGYVGGSDGNYANKANARKNYSRNSCE